MMGQAKFQENVAKSLKTSLNKDYIPKRQNFKLLSITQLKRSEAKPQTDKQQEVRGKNQGF